MYEQPNTYLAHSVGDSTDEHFGPKNLVDKQDFADLGHLQGHLESGTALSGAPLVHEISGRLVCAVRKAGPLLREFVTVKKIVAGLPFIWGSMELNQV